MVAPPYARLTVSTNDLLYIVVKQSIQLGPLEDVCPLQFASVHFIQRFFQGCAYGYVGLPRGLPGAGCERETLNAVVVYESPLEGWLVGKQDRCYNISQGENVLDLCPARVVRLFWLVIW